MTEERECRICMSSEDEDNLFTPCLCKGSSKYVHRECLNSWRMVDPTSKNFTQCSTCHYTYEFEGTRSKSSLISAVILELSEFITMFMGVFIMVYACFNCKSESWYSALIITVFIIGAVIVAYLIEIRSTRILRCLSYAWILLIPQLWCFSYMVIIVLGVILYIAGTSLYTRHCRRKGNIKIRNVGCD